MKPKKSNEVDGNAWPFRFTGLEVVGDFHLKLTWTGRMMLPGSVSFVPVPEEVDITTSRFYPNKTQLMRAYREYKSDLENS